MPACLPAEDQLQRLPAEVPPPPPPAEQAEGEEELNFLTLRQLAAEWMRAHAEEFKPFVLEVGGGAVHCLAFGAAWQGGERHAQPTAVHAYA